LGLGPLWISFLILERDSPSPPMACPGPLAEHCNAGAYGQAGGCKLCALRFQVGDKLPHDASGRERSERVLAAPPVHSNDMIYCGY